MRKVKVYKHIRKKPQIWGFTPNAFYIFSGGSLLSCSILLFGFSFKKIIIVGILIFIILIVTKVFMSNSNFIRKFSDEKFPKEISPLTKNKNGK